MTNKTIDFNQLAKDILNNRKDYTYIGFRSLTENDKKEVGAILQPSYDHDFELDVSTFETTGETLNGTSATSIIFDFDTIYETKEEQLEELEEALKEAMEDHKSYSDYFGRVIIGGDVIEYGDDHKEVIIEDAEILVVLY